VKKKRSEVDDIDIKRLVDFRRKNFAVKVEDVPEEDRKWGSDIVLSVTPNGTQWTPIGLSREEALVVIRELQAKVDSMEVKS